jgi:hypothetical protein
LCGSRDNTEPQRTEPAEQVQVFCRVSRQIPE